MVTAIILNQHFDFHFLSIKHANNGHNSSQENEKYFFLVIKPARSAGFSLIKKIPYQALPTQLGPRKCTFSKKAFLGPKYQCKDFYFFGKFLKNYQAQLFYVLSFPLGYLKTAQKTVQ